MKDLYRPPIEVKFSSNKLIDFEDRSDNLIRLLQFRKISRDPSLKLGMKEAGAGLSIPSIEKFDTELWLVNGEKTLAKELKSKDNRIRIIKIGSPTYTFVRILCTEKKPETLTSLPDKPNISELHELTYLAYEKVFKLINSGILPKNIIRMWNFVPRILDHHTKIKEWDYVNSERYRQFNTGRKQAWIDHSNLQTDKTKSRFRVPAATGIGSNGGPLVIEAILTNEKIVDIPNPIQINAYSYSDKYGTNQPMFSRATVQLTKEGGVLFIAGTASITGEDTKYNKDPVAQTHQTFKNLQAIISTENLSGYLPFKPRKVSLLDLEGVRVHIKRKSHLPAMKKVVKEYLGEKEVCYVQDDICRKNLLLEIESNGTLISVK